MTEDEILALPYRPCVGVVVVNREGSVFAAQRLDSDYDAWQMPQGGVDPGEDPKDAALRELEEETGITPDKVEVVAVCKDWIPYELPFELVPKLWKGRYRGQTQLWYLVRFLGEDTEINIETEIPEFSKWAWMEPSDLIDRIVPFKKLTYEKVFAELKDFF